MSGDLVIQVYGTPAPQGSKRHLGRGIMVESSAKVKPWRQDVKYAAMQALTDDATGPFREPMTGPVSLRVTFTLTRPKGHYRTGANAALLRAAAPTDPAGKPDLDKLLRSTLDALGEAGVWRDDAQVVRIVAEKVYGPVAGAHIVVKDMNLAPVAPSPAPVDDLAAAIGRHPAGSRRAT